MQPGTGLTSMVQIEHSDIWSGRKMTSADKVKSIIIIIFLLTSTLPLCFQVNNEVQFQMYTRVKNEIGISYSHSHQRFSAPSRSTPQDALFMLSPLLQGVKTNAASITTLMEQWPNRMNHVMIS